MTEIFQMLHGHLLRGRRILGEIISGALGRTVVLQIPTTPLFVGSYLKVGVIIDRSANLSFEDLDFIVPAGPEGGGVSLSREDDFDPSKPDVLLLCGYKPGKYRLQAVKKSSGKVMAEANFQLTTLSADDGQGPSLWVSGNFELPGIAGAAWGGGMPSEPENYNVSPMNGVRNVAVLLVDTASQRFNPGDISTITTLWQDVAFNGSMVNGQLVSADHYYREVSYNNLSITGQVFGPVSLSGLWSDYFQDSGEPKGNFWQACATAGDPLINVQNFKHLVCVVQSIDQTASTPARRVWPWAQSIVAKTAEGDIAIGEVAIPADGTPFQLCAALVHELGHNIGLGGDVYAWSGHPPQVQARQMGGWDIMADHTGLPHPCIVHRMRMGWVPKGSIKLYNFESAGGAIDETLILNPLELGNPPGGRYSGVEIRISSGWNYYFEYRVTQPNQVGDRNLPANDRVLGTDVMYGDNLEDVARRKPVMLLEPDSDGDGPILSGGQDYKEQDISEPNFPTDFRFSVTQTDGTKANVRIQYGVSSQPDPSIRPWNPPVYQSPDIEIRNARNQADQKWFNVPWENRENTVVAKVTNLGAMNAPGVEVDFYIYDMTVNNPGNDPKKKPPIRFGHDVKDVPAQQTIEFSTIWRPKKGGHYCIEARIRHYQTPGPNSVIEATEYNNRAQSNYDRFISETASWPSRKSTSIHVHNPFDRRIRVFMRVAKSTSPLFRTYLEHTWLLLDPGEAKSVKAMFEYAFERDPVWNPAMERYVGKPNDVSIDAVAYEHDVRRQTPIALGGVTIQIVKGRATRFERFVFDSPAATGRVVTVNDENPVPGGTVILTITAGEKDIYRKTEVSTKGVFRVEATGGWDSIQAYYVPLNGYADCESNIIKKS